MNVKRQVGAAADLSRHFQNLDAPAREAADLGVALDAAHDVFVGVRRLDGGVDVDAIGTVEIGVVMAFKAADQISRQERINLRLRLLDNEVPEARQRHARRAALVDHRGDAGAHADHVRVQAEAAGDVLINVSMGVDQAGQDQLAGDVDHLARAGRKDRGFDGGDAAVADRNVANAVDSGGRANDAPAAEEKVIGGLFGHGTYPCSLSRLNLARFA